MLPHNKWALLEKCGYRLCIQLLCSYNQSCAEADGKAVSSCYQDLSINLFSCLPSTSVLFLRDGVTQAEASKR